MTNSIDLAIYNTLLHAPNQTMSFNSLFSSMKSAFSGATGGDVMQAYARLIDAGDIVGENIGDDDLHTVRIAKRRSPRHDYIG
jgi:hypothetical protein